MLQVLGLGRSVERREVIETCYCMKQKLCKAVDVED